MIRIITCVAALALLSGCATLGTVGSAICAHEVETRTALELALVKAQQITDPQKRQVAIQAINVSLDALDRCPNAR